MILVFRRHSLYLLQPTASNIKMHRCFEAISLKVMKLKGRLMKFIIHICIHIIYIYKDRFPPPHKQEIISCILNKTTSLAKIKSLTEAASAYLDLLCTSVLAINCRVLVVGGCKGDMWQEAANCNLC